MFRLDPRRLQLEKFHSGKPIESLSDIKRERERRGELSRMHRYPLPLLSFSPPQSLDNRRCVRVLSPELTPQGISRFLCVDCWTSNKDEAGGYPLASHRYTGTYLPFYVSKDRPLWSVKGLEPTLARVHLQNDFPASTRATWLTHASPSLSPIFRDIRRIACLLSAIVFQRALHAHVDSFNLVFFSIDQFVPSTRDGIPFLSVWIRNGTNGWVSFKDLASF